MRKVLSLVLLAGVAAFTSAGAQAHVNVDVGVGIPVPYVAAPVYAPVPVYEEPAPVVIQRQPVVLSPGYYEDWRARAWREREWREHQEHEWRERQEHAWQAQRREWHHWRDD
ncbi:hypothetical protein AWV80_34910 [Cupriavidus sp. UYMU48A]|nr:hypothetical protein AWV80_34910 [Cupriavidus sp. UYMU48A]